MKDLPAINFVNIFFPQIFYNNFLPNISANHRKIAYYRWNLNAREIVFNEAR